MVEVKELAILFKRIKNEDESIETFIPVKVIEGYFDEKEALFVDKQENTYPHLAENVSIGNCFGLREDISTLLSKYPKLTLKEIKEKYLEKAKEKNKKYQRNNDDFYIYTYVNNLKYKFKDKDTKEIYSMYEETFPDDFASEIIIKLDTIDENNQVLEEEPVTESIPKLNFNTPKELVDEIRKTIKGQDESIKKIVTNIWTYKKFPESTKKNMLVVGPSGSGKTAILQKLSKLLDIPLTVFSVPGLSQAGYVGRSTDEILIELYTMAESDVSKAEGGIVVLDEIDKLSSKEHGGDVSTTAVQDELLKIIEGDKRIVNLDKSGLSSFMIDTSKIIFIGAGAFSEIYEEKNNRKSAVGFGNNTKEIDIISDKLDQDKLSNYGLKREILGRMPVIVELNNLKKEDLKDIILNSDESELHKILKILSSMGVTVKNIDEVIDMITEDAINKKIGARGLVSTINEMFLNIFYEIANNEGLYDEVILGPNIINDNTDYELINKSKIKVRKRTKE